MVILKLAETANEKFEACFRKSRKNFSKLFQKLLETLFSIFTKIMLNGWDFENKYVTITISKRFCINSTKIKRNKKKVKEFHKKFRENFW